MTKNIIEKVISYQLSVIRSRRGQSLVEVVIGLAIGAILMGTAVFVVTKILKTNLTSERSQFSSQFAQSLSDNVRALAAGDWRNIYNLTKSENSHYFLNASGTTFIVVEGEEGVLDGDVPDGLVGQWKFDEVETSTSTTTYDATGNNLNGTLTNGPTRATSTCRISNCLSFDEVDDYVNVADNASLDIVGAITVAAWINPTGPDTQDALVSKAAGWGSGVPSGFILGSANDSTYGFKIGNGTNSDRAGLTANPTAGAWTHIVGVADSDAVYIYEDGILATSTSRTIGDMAGSFLTQSVVMGRISYTSAWYFQGLMDDVRIYNRALSADEIRQLHNSGIYKRFFTVANVCRTNDASSTIAGVTPCSGTVEDSSTQWVTNFVQWVTGGGTSEISLPAIVTRSRNEVFHQTDWSGGATNEGAVTRPTGKFSSSTNASTTGGVIQIQNLSQE